VGAILLLLVQLPFILLAFTLGGVTLVQVAAAYCSLAAYLVLLANVGLLCSVVFRRGGLASSVTAIAIILYVIAAGALRFFALGLTTGGLVAPGSRMATALDRTARWWEDASIAFRINEIVKTGFHENPIGFQVVFSLCGALLCFVLSWVVFNRCTRDLHVSGPVRTDLLGPLIHLGRRRRSRPGKRLLEWKEFHFVAGGMPVQIVKFVAYGAFSAAIFWAAERYYNYAFARAGEFVAQAMLAVIVIESGLYASVLFHDEWRDRTLPLLAMLPVRTSNILYSKLAGCAPALLPALFWLLVGCMIWPDGLEQVVKCLLPSRLFFVLIWLLFLTLTIFFSLVVRWGALPLALAVMAGGAVCATICGLPVIGFYLAASQGGGVSEPGLFFVDAVIIVLIILLQTDVRRRIEIASSQ
jgi:hypothetical protein